MRMRHIVICGLPDTTIFFHIIKGTIFGGKKSYLTQNVCFDPIYNMSEKFFILRRTERDMIKNVYWSARKAAVILVRF